MNALLYYSLSMKNILNRKTNVPPFTALLSTLLAMVMRSPVRLLQLVLLTATILLYISSSPNAAETAATPIPHGDIAQHSGPGITAAWYACPTTRYRHGVLGDSIEGGCLRATSAQGQDLEVVLDDSAVFEDVTPRLADIDGDGQNDIVTIRSGVDSGAALVVYGLRDGTLQEIAATPAIGLANRWLAPAGIANFDGKGNNDIAYVETPHLGGLLRIWSMVDGVFTEIASARGFSNHSIGESRVSLSRVLDYNDDGISDLALPTFGRQNIVVVTMVPSFSIIQTQDFDKTYFD